MQHRAPARPVQVAFVGKCGQLKGDEVGQFDAPAVALMAHISAARIEDMIKFMSTLLP